MAKEWDDHRRVLFRSQLTKEQREEMLEDKDGTRLLGKIWSSFSFFRSALPARQGPIDAQRLLADRHLEGDSVAELLLLLLLLVLRC